jgi:hypothetical protein
MHLNKLNLALCMKVFLLIWGKVNMKKKGGLIDHQPPVSGSLLVILRYILEIHNSEIHYNSEIHNNSKS